MIHFDELDRVNGGEVVYTWENPDPPGGVRMWAVGRMEKWCRETDHQVLVSNIDPARAEWFIENRGVEKHRISWLLDNQEALLNPALMMRMKRNSVLHVEGGELWDLMLDGHHRYVALALMDIPIFKLWHLSEEEAKPFEVFGLPQPRGPLNVKAFSGLGLDR